MSLLGLRSEKAKLAVLLRLGSPKAKVGVGTLCRSLR
jgi:hypothetical protein